MHGHSPASGSALGLGVVVSVMAFVAAAAYVLAARRLRRRGDGWSWWAQGSWLAGLTAAVVAVAYPLPGAMFTAHMGTHLLLGMVAPLLLVLARPVTLLLRASPPGRARRTVVAVAHSRAAGVLVYPPVAAVLDVGGLWLLYRTPLFAGMTDHPWLTLVVHTHVFAAGVLYSFALCQLDPVRRRHGFGLRAATLLAAGSAHAVLAKSLYVFPPPGTTLDHADLQHGAVLMYYGGDAVEAALAVVLAAQWYVRVGRDRRRAHRRSALAAPDGRVFGRGRVG
ncbi:cytochrome c oxidase assembly protein [Rhodococcus hoagii]|nr:cytochrome c oxidase assembly protein [Prescottella equi]